MNPFSRHPTIARFVLAALAGILIAVAFPKREIAGAAWVGPGLLLFATAGAPPGLAFRVGFVGGLGFYLTALYWLLFIPLKFVPVIGWLALSLYLAFFPAIWVCLAWRLFPGRITPTDAPFDDGLARTIRETSWLARSLWVLEVAALWVALEIVLGRFLSGFPWLFLGGSQYEILPLIQMSSVTGIYGVSFMVVWFSVALLCAGFAMTRYPVVRGSWAREIALPFVALLVILFFGSRTIRRYQESFVTLKVALIQPSIPQTLIWNPAEDNTRFNQLTELSERALETEPDLMIWPEASVPNMLRYHEETGVAVRRLATEHDVWVILGSDDAEMRPGGSKLEDIDFFNSAFAISPEGDLKGIYKKRRLVIFGEYVPFGKHLPFLRMLTPAAEGGFTPGRAPVPFHLESLDVTVSVLICFEDVFPHLVREYVQPNTDFLVNLTNNGWFGESAAQWQHAASAAFRAVENRIPLVRCANNGLTCWVDPLGRMHEVYFPEHRDVYTAGFKTAMVPTLKPGHQRALSFYTRHGDGFGWSCAGLVAAHLLFLRFASGTRKGSETLA